MKYIKRELYGDNVNVSQTSPVGELFTLITVALGSLFVVYFLLGLLVDFIVPRLTPGIEGSLGKKYAKIYSPKLTSASAPLQKLVEKLAQNIPNDNRNYTARIIENSQINAMAFPGGNILVFSGLIKAVRSENELAFVMAHELGHFANRDHLRAMGRGLIIMSGAIFLFGQDNSLTNFMVKSLMTVETKFSQKQETDADLWALSLLNQTYGHVAGATDFIKQVITRNKSGRFLYYFSTHPYPNERLKTLERQIHQEGYSERNKKPLLGFANGPKQRTSG